MHSWLVEEYRPSRSWPSSSNPNIGSMDAAPLQQRPGSLCRLVHVSSEQQAGGNLLRTGQRPSLGRQVQIFSPKHVYLPLTTTRIAARRRSPSGSRPTAHRSGRRRASIVVRLDHPKETSNCQSMLQQAERSLAALKSPGSSRLFLMRRRPPVSDLPESLHRRLLSWTATTARRLITLSRSTLHGLAAFNLCPFPLSTAPPLSALLHLFSPTKIPKTRQLVGDGLAGGRQLILRNLASPSGRLSGPGLEGQS